MAEFSSSTVLMRRTGCIGGNHRSGQRHDRSCRTRLNSIRLALLALFLLSATVAEVCASETLHHFNIDADTADVGLTELAKQSGTPLLFDYDVVRGVSGRAVVGFYTVDQALSQLLFGTPLQGHVNEQGVITVETRNTQSEGGEVMSEKQSVVGRIVGALAAVFTVSGSANAQEPADAPRNSGGDIEEIVVTASSRPESLSRIVSTVSVINEDMIERSAAKSVAELLSENAVAFLSEWSPGQTQINLRGGTTDGQGRDFRSQVLVLLNGRRAGTANISKLSPAAVSRVEIVRGPSSVIYGSQNIGGVVNIITKSGATESGGEVQLSAGSWEYFQGSAQYAGASGDWDWFLGASMSQRDDYDAGDGAGTQVNTAWERRGLTGALGYQFDASNRIQVTARTDGIYDAGFRGSSANYVSVEDRFNRSLDVVYTGDSGERIDWLAHAYLVNDVDDFNWASPIIRSNGMPAPGTSSDHNKRDIEIIGTRLQPRFQFGEDNELLVGWDWEHSTIRSTRVREGVDGASISQVPPFDNNQTEDLHAVYFEDVQELFNDRVTLRGGFRWTTGETSIDPTPNQTGLVARSEDYDATTFAAGFTFQATDSVTLRAGVASGFRAPNATELASDFTSVGGNRTFGNPDLEPESSDQVEVGLRFSGFRWRGDVALFRNVIKDRIVRQPRPGVDDTNDYVNNPDEVSISGIELQLSTDLFEGNGLYWSLTGGGSYHWDMEDKGAPESANTRNVQRVYEYQAAITTELGSDGDAGRAWRVNLNGVLHGPVWYNTEEKLLIPFAEPNGSYIHEKDAFWVWNLRSELQLTDSWDAFFSVNNLLDENYNPIFVAIDQPPYLLDPAYSNGGLGTSMPGREFRLGVRMAFGGED